MFSEEYEYWSEVRAEVDGELEAPSPWHGYMKFKKGPAPKFARAPDWLLDLRPPSTAVHLYLVLIRRVSNGGDGECWPGRETLAEEIGKSTSTVDRNLKVLADLGAVRWRAAFSPTGDRTSNRYYVYFSRPAADGVDEATPPPG